MFSFDIMMLTALLYITVLAQSTFIIKKCLETLTLQRRKQDEAMIALFLYVSRLYAHFVVAPQGSVYPPSILGKTGRNAESWFPAH